MLSHCNPTYIQSVQETLSLRFGGFSLEWVQNGWLQTAPEILRSCKHEGGALRSKCAEKKRHVTNRDKRKRLHKIQSYVVYLLSHIFPHSLLPTFFIRIHRTGEGSHQPTKCCQIHQTTIVHAMNGSFCEVQAV